LGTPVPGRKAMVETKRELSCLVKWHLVLVLAAKLGESANSLVDPLIAVDLQAARRLYSSRSCGGVGSRFRDDGVDFPLKSVSAGLDDDHHWSISGTRREG